MDSTPLAPYPPSAIAARSSRSGSEMSEVTEPKTAGSKLSAEEVLVAVNVPRRRRWVIILAFPLFILLALPYWYATTSIERLPLPVERISALESVRDPYIRTNIAFTADDEVFPPTPEGKGHFPKHVKLEALAEVVVKGIDGIIQGESPKTRGSRRWDLVVDEKKAASAPLRVHLGVYDTANATWPLEPFVQTADGPLPEGTLVIPVHPSMISDRNLKTHYKIALVNGIHNLLPSRLPSIPKRALAYSPNITLSFVVLNEDASDGSYVDQWDIDSALQDHVLPHLDALSPLWNFTIESQVLYHAPLTFEPTEVENATGDKLHLLDEDQMKTFVSERWSLDSHSTNNPVLKFLLYIPSARHRPLRLHVDSPSFLFPQFGSVVLLNPPPSSTGSFKLTQAALDAPFAHFTDHLYSLLALPPLPAKLNLSPPREAKALRGLKDPFNIWQLDNVLRVRMAENAAEARKTLSGIVRLVDKIGEMKVGPGVRDKVLGAVRKLEGLPAAARSPSPLPAFLLARDAVGLANEAFFDPAMMGLLYFPDQHKFAVYTPLFAPIGVSITVGLLRELVAWKKRRGKKVKFAKTE